MRYSATDQHRQGTQIMSTYVKCDRYIHPLTAFFSVWLTYWQDEKFSLPWSIYEGVYAALGVSSAIFTFAMGATMGVMAYFASNALHGDALDNVFYSPMSVFETQPLGRILGVFGKDVDTIDNQLADSWRMLAMTLVSVRVAFR